MSAHVVTVETHPEGYLGKCQTCGDRNEEFTGYGEASMWADRHEGDSRALRLNAGPRGSLTTLEREYRRKAELPVYSVEEKRQWLILADEIAERIKTKKDSHIDGQLDLFGDV